MAKRADRADFSYVATTRTCAGEMTLRPYQEEAIGAVRAAFAAGRRAPLLVAPTGAGKTVMFCYVTQGAKAKGRRVMILAHRAELLDQTSRALLELGISHGMIAAGRTADRTEAVQVAGVQTLVRRLGNTPPPDLLVIDEAHHAAAGSWRAIVQAFPSAKILGVTATPERLDGKGLGDVFDDLIRGPEVADLIAAGFLSRPVYYAPTTASLNGVRTTAGDYNKADLEQAVNRPTITGDAVTHYQRLCPGVPAIAFCTSIAHAENVAANFREAGFRWGVIDGTMSAEARRQAVADLGTGALHGLSSCEIVSEGFDLPCVTAAILLRPTKSLSLYLQQVGRVLRPHLGKQNAVILDHVGNVIRHGLAEELREWSLDGDKERRKKRKTDDGMKNRQCPSCYAIHAPGPVCPLCGHEYEVQGRKVEEVEGELIQLDAERLATITKRQVQGNARTLGELVALGRARGYKNPTAWASYVFTARRKRGVPV